MSNRAEEPLLVPGRSSAVVANIPCGTSARSVLQPSLHVRNVHRRVTASISIEPTPGSKSSISSPSSAISTSSRAGVRSIVSGTVAADAPPWRTALASASATISSGDLHAWICLNVLERRWGEIEAHVEHALPHARQIRPRARGACLWFPYAPHQILHRLDRSGQIGENRRDDRSAAHHARALQTPGNREQHALRRPVEPGAEDVTLAADALRETRGPMRADPTRPRGALPLPVDPAQPPLRR